jgi:alkanesulfonate monooxygenase SsuD/methylene tetrahydromethanopterin reductase-like flavin-dependent oxidoreductase (luciferase family)
MPLETRRESVLHLAATAERLSYETLYLPETWSWDVTVTLAELALRTQRIRLATAVLGIWGRSAATLAMAASTLDTLSGGRFTLGLGVSTAQLTEGLHDVPFEAPIGRLRQIVTQVRALLQGDRVPLYAMPGARALRLNLAGKPELPIYVAGLAENTVRLCGELADGWLPFLFARDRLPDAVGWLEEGMTRRDRPAPLPRVCPVVPAVVSHDPDEAREGAAWFVSFYLTKMGPLYAASLRRQGFAREVDAVLAANTGHGPGVVPREADVLLEQLTVFGTPDEARDRLAEWRSFEPVAPTVMLRPDLDAEQVTFELESLCGASERGMPLPVRAPAEHPTSPSARP